MIRRPPISTLTDTLFPYTTLFRSSHIVLAHRAAFAFQPVDRAHVLRGELEAHPGAARVLFGQEQRAAFLQRVTQAGLGTVIELGAACLEIGQPARSAARPLGKECVSQCRSRWSPYR